MKTTQTPWMAWFAALLLAIPFVARSQNQIPAAINYQGRLTDTLGDPVSSGYYEIEFRLWDDAAQTGAGNLVWGRTFPLHVVADGLFNILLTDDGGVITSPTTPTNTLLTAFGGQDRYLGLTIVLSNGVSVANSEISPRQQLASAPYAVQSQTANSVRALGVSSAALANGAVVQGKLAAEAVTSGNIAIGAVIAGKLANNAVTTASITNGAVTSAKLNINGDVHMNNHTLFLRSGTDMNHGLNWETSFGGQSLDGPALFGSQSGVLGTTDGGEKVALEWSKDTSVTMHGPMNVRGGSVSMFGPLATKQFETTYTAQTDGIVLFSGYAGHWQFVLMNSSGTPIWTNRMNGATSGANYKMASFPVAKGERWRWERDSDHPNETVDVAIRWRPLGVGN